MHALSSLCFGNESTHTHQGAYKSGKPGNVREFVNSGKLWKNSGNLKFSQGILLAVFS